MENEIKELISTLTDLKNGNYTNGFIREHLGICIRKLNAIKNEMSESQNSSTSDEASHIADVVKPKGTLPCIQRCSVCKMTMVNWFGSTPCCGGMAEYLYEDEVEELGFVVDMTRNKGTVRPV